MFFVCANVGWIWGLMMLYPPSRLWAEATALTPDSDQLFDRGNFGLMEGEWSGVFGFLFF